MQIRAYANGCKCDTVLQIIFIVANSWKLTTNLTKILK